MTTKKVLIEVEVPDDFDRGINSLIDIAEYDFKFIDSPPAAQGVSPDDPNNNLTGWVINRPEKAAAEIVDLRRQLEVLRAQPAPIADSEPVAAIDPDELPCEKCGGKFLDTGWECNDCGHDNIHLYGPKLVAKGEECPYCDQLVDEACDTPLRECKAKPVAKVEPMARYGLQKVDANGFIPCPACDCSDPSVVESVELTYSRCDDHYRHYECSCGFTGPKSFYNKFWDEAKCAEDAKKKWNTACLEAYDRRAQSAEAQPLPAPTQQEAANDETGWLIENGRQFEELRYRFMDNDAGGVIGWTPDHAKALRFARRADAEQFCYHDEDAWRVVEHMWCGDPIAAPTQAERSE